MNFVGMKSPVDSSSVDSLIHKSSSNGHGGGQQSSEYQYGGYEELMKGSVPCPTCRGSGKVPKELEAQLIALIPVNDKRLNPKTKCKVALAVAVCILVGGLTIFFLIPRSVSISTDEKVITPLRTYVNTSIPFVFLSIAYEFTITNSNFYPVTISNAELEGLFDKKKMAHGLNTTRVSVPIRSSVVHFIKMNITFNAETKGADLFCIWVSHIPMEFDVSIKSEYLGHKEQISMESMQSVSCNAAAANNVR